jgi:hypothetical protein
MRILNQKMMNHVFEVTDALEIDREHIEIPLTLKGEGSVCLRRGQVLEITLPDTEDFSDFLEKLPVLIEQVRLEGKEKKHS